MRQTVPSVHIGALLVHVSITIGRATGCTAPDGLPPSEKILQYGSVVRICSADLQHGSTVRTPLRSPMHGQHLCRMAWL